jgi:uncharacterized protein (DUF433 family)
MSLDLESLQQQLKDALTRLERLEQRAEEETAPRWQFLVARAHPWRRQLCIKGRNVTVGQLVSVIRANRLDAEQAADDLGLPVDAIREALTYYEENRALIELEASEDRRRLRERGYALEPPAGPR